MSRWSVEFESHPFQAIWSQLKATLSELEVDDQTIPTSVQELARLKRVITYLDEIIASIDPDITPKSVWGNFEQQASSCLGQLTSYSSTKNIAAIVTANDHADNLLTYLKPYFVLPPDVIKALHQSARTYYAEMDSLIDSFRTRASAVANELQKNQGDSAAYLAETLAAKEKVGAFAQSIFSNAEDQPSLEQRLNDATASIQRQANEINGAHEKLIVGDESTRAGIENAAKEIGIQVENIRKTLDNTDSRVAELNTFHTKIFGEKDPSTGEPINGLAHELDQRIKQLKKFEEEQISKHDALFNRIENLLPGATSAGLATEYKTLRKYFSRPVKKYTQVFYGALLTLVVAAIYTSVKQISFSPSFSITFIEANNWDYVLQSLAYKLPFIGPIVWLALFASARRSQYERLQQEYSHKQALAASYESYKTQLRQLQGETDALQRELLAKAIESLAYNASTTLDKKHGDKTPIHELIDKLTENDIRKLAEKIGDFIKPQGKA